MVKGGGIKPPRPSSPSLLSFLLAGSKRILDWLLPPHCLACSASLQGEGRLCNPCWRELDFLMEPCCIQCGFPFELSAISGAYCASCLQHPPAYDLARAVMAYTEISKRLILPFKHADRLDGVSLFALWLERLARDHLQDADRIVPVPLHWTRLWRRKYNQAALIAHALGQRTHIPVDTSLLQRVRRTPSQGDLTLEQRQKNVKNAFVIKRRQEGKLQGKKIILLDDVYTSGATVNACADQLKRAGARMVVVLTLARALRGR